MNDTEQKKFWSDLIGRVGLCPSVAQVVSAMGWVPGTVLRARAGRGTITVKIIAVDPWIVVPPSRPDVTGVVCEVIEDSRGFPAQGVPFEPILFSAALSSWEIVPPRLEI
jgi:hypothetical protein